MTFAYPEVDVGTNTYTTYSDVAAADIANGAQIVDTGWDGATDDIKGRSLVSSTRWLDEANWLGEKTDSDQEHAWPRSGITGVASDSLPSNLVAACNELAAQMVADPSLRTSLGTPLPRSLRAGPASIDYFRPNDVFIATFFPAQIMSLVRDWIEGAGASCPVITTGTDAESSLDDDLGFQHGF